MLKIPKAKGVHVPYRLLAQLAAVAPANAVEEFVVKRLVSYGMVAAGSEDLSRRIAWVSKWGSREGRAPFEAPEMSPKARKAVREFAMALEVAKDADGVQNAAFEALKRNGLKPGEFFPAVYGILLGSDRGPRLGPYVMDAGQSSVSQSLLKAVGK
jgi:lysyl-tRNA synthetase, class I